MSAEVCTWLLLALISYTSKLHQLVKEEAKQKRSRREGNEEGRRKIYSFLIYILQLFVKRKK
jgi:hypothetical protein